jgi:hypothetical protein
MSNPRRGEPRPITVAGYKAISIGADGSVFAIHKSGDIVRWEGKAWRKVEHSIPNPAEIAVDPRGQPWVLAQDGSIFAFGDAKAKAKLTKQMINIPCPDNFASRPVISASAPLPEGWNGPGLRLNDISDVKFVGARYVPEANQKTYRLECRYGESKAKNGMPYSMVKNGLLPGCSHPSFKPEKTGPGHFACMEKEERQCILTCPSI